MARERGYVGRVPGLWALRVEVVWLRLSIWRARRHPLGAHPAVLAEAYRRLAKLYGSLLLYRTSIAKSWRASRLERAAVQHAADAQWFGHLAAVRGGRGGPIALREHRGPLPDGPDAIGVRHPRGPRPPALVGGAAAQIEQYLRVRAVAGGLPGGVPPDDVDVSFGVPSS